MSVCVPSTTAYHSPSPNVVSSAERIFSPYLNVASAPLTVMVTSMVPSFFSTLAESPKVQPSIVPELNIRPSIWQPVTVLSSALVSKSLIVAFVMVELFDNES